MGVTTSNATQMLSPAGSFRLGRKGKGGEGTVICFCPNVGVRAREVNGSNTRGYFSVDSREEKEHAK